MKKFTKKVLSLSLSAIMVTSYMVAFAEGETTVVSDNNSYAMLDITEINPELCASSLSQTTVKVTSKPQTVDKLNGVAAKYIPGTGNSNTGTYCCAQYVKNYYKSVYGVTVSNLTTGKTPSVNKGKIKNVTSSRSYKVGDIFYQKNSSGSGHWAIVKAVSGNKIYLIEQNWKWKSGSTTYTYKNRTITYSKSGTLSWTSNGKTVNGVKIFRWSK